MVHLQMRIGSATVDGCAYWRHFLI